MRSNRIIPIIVILLLSAVLGACTQYKRTPLHKYSSKETEQYRAITLNDKEYVPFCAVSNSDRGAQIGIVDGDDKDQIYEYKGYPEDQWIISFYDSGLMDGSMLYREIAVTEIPDGLKSEYDWNSPK